MSIMIDCFNLTFLHSGITSEYLKTSSSVMIMCAKKLNIIFYLLAFSRIAAWDTIPFGMNKNFP